LFGMAMIIGTAVPSAMRLSAMNPARPSSHHPDATSPPPQVAKPDLAQMRLVIRPQHPPCDKEYTRRQTGDRRQTVIEASTVAAPRPIRLG